MTITASADGSALGNPGPAGWAWYVDDDNWAAGGWKHATNNQGELKAVLELFRATEQVNDDLLILCDSQYVINSVTKWMPGWKKKGWRKGDGKPVMNVELLQEIDAAIAGRRYRFEWVRGHVGHVLNEAADVRARAAAEAYQRSATVPSGPGWSGGAGHTVSLGGETAHPGEMGNVGTVTPSGPGQAGQAGVVLQSGPGKAGDPASAVPFEAGGTDSETDALFSLDDTEWHTVELQLTSEEFQRLARRAREHGIGPDEFLRGLI